MAKQQIAALLESALKKLGIQEGLDFSVDIPRHKGLGDYATNVALLAAKKLSKNPLQFADEVAAEIKELDQGKLIKNIEVAKPGFINFTLADDFLCQTIKTIHKQNHNWGKHEPQKAKQIMLEFVSANPTGPLHVGHGRWAVVGDAIARILKAAGYDLRTECYVNNVGNQVEMLEASVLAARRGQAIPEGGYGGSYVAEVKGNDRAEMVDYFIDQQKLTLDALKVNFDRWFKESDLHKDDKITQAIARLKENGKTYEKDGAIWFRSEEMGDDKDRVLMRDDGRPTYFAADVAYHLNKFERGFGHVIDIWGTDHHGYVKRLKCAIQALDQPIEEFEIIIGQLVTLYRENEPVRMSKRTGEMITLDEVIEEIGADATRFFFAMTDVNSHLDFDLELAKKRSNDNPVYYLQYAHARICSILKKSETRNPKSDDLSSLTHPAERALMLKLLAWPEMVSEAARVRGPHRITEYGKELATLFHSFYEQCKVLGNPARLVLVDASRITLRNVLELLGITAPESM